MVYLSTIPAAGDRPSQSQPQLLENFNQLNTQYGTTGDHVEFTASTGNGKHKRSTLVEQLGDQTTVADEMSLYTKNNGGTPDLYLRRESNGTVLQVTNNAQAPTSGSASFINGLQIRSGTSGYPGDSAFVNFSTPFPTACICVLTTNSGSGNNSATVNVLSFNQTQFQVLKVNGASGPNFAYIAIGY